MLHIPSLYIAKSQDKGRGVFTAEPISEGSIIELCPLIIIPATQVKAIHETVLHDYYFLYPEPKGSACLALGYGSLYNHSSVANTELEFDLDNQYLRITALTDIAVGSEIYFNYNGDERTPLIWFDEK